MQPKNTTMKFNTIFGKPYLYWLLGIFIFYLALTIYISEFYITLQYLGIYADQIHWGKLLLGIIFTITIAALVAINSVYGYLRYKEKKKVQKSGTLACVGTIGGLATGVCSSCVTSVFPLILGAFGISFTWASLPFQGLEIQALIIVILGTSLYFLMRK